MEKLIYLILIEFDITYAVNIVSYMNVHIHATEQILFYLRKILERGSCLLDLKRLVLKAILI